MFISDLFEAPQLKTLVIIPGGFHPFHPGHLSLYRSAQQAFPGATIVYAATDDQKERPFAFSDKQKLAQIAGVNPQNFQLVRSPFVAKEITQHFDPDTTILVFARSEKDRNEQPKPGGMKKDGTPAYLQIYDPKHLEPMSRHGYMAYLPVVQFDAGPSGVTSATQIRNMWPRASDKQKNEIVTDLYPKNPAVARQILDKYLGGAMAEGWKDKLGAAALVAAPIIGGIGANMVAPNTSIQGHQAQLATPGKIPDNAKLVTDDNGKKVYVWRSYPMKTSPGNTEGQLVYRPAEQVKEQDMAEDGDSMDPTVIQMKKRARIAHPFAKSDEEALALYVADKSKQAVKGVRDQQTRDERIIDRIDKAESKLEKEVRRIDQEIAQILAMKNK